MVFLVAREWCCFVPGRVVNGNAGWFECGVFSITAQDYAMGATSRIKVMLVLEASHLSQGVDIDAHDGNRCMHYEEEMHGDTTNCVNTTSQRNKDVDSEDGDTQSASSSSMFCADQPTIYDVSQQLGDSNEVDEDDVLAAEEQFLAAIGGEADAFVGDTIGEPLDSVGAM